MKILAITILALTLAGCGQWERTKAHYTGWSESCVDGVTYIQFPSGVTPKYEIRADGVAVIKGCK